MIFPFQFKVDQVTNGRSRISSTRKWDERRACIRTGSNDWRWPQRWKRFPHSGQTTIWVCRFSRAGTVPMRRPPLTRTRLISARPSLRTSSERCSKTSETTTASKKSDGNGMDW